MGIEIERKFLLKTTPKDLLQGCTGQSIDQGYLVLDPERELRVRRKGGDYYLTSKSSGGLVRTENEQRIDVDQFELLWPFTEGRRLQKTRFAVDVNGHQGDLDVYSGSLDGLIVLEIEFEDVERAGQFVVPDYVLKELTEDKRYKNAYLALQGLPVARE